MPTDVDDRVRALERAVTERDDPAAPIPAIADVNRTVKNLDERVSELETLVADLAARQEAVEAYVDRIEHVNESIERRADAALAAVDRLETTRGPPTASSATADSRAPKHDPEEQRLDTGGESHAAHVSDAATIGTAADEGQNENDDSGSDGLLARLVGL